MPDDLLVLIDGLVVLDCPHRCQLLKGERTPIYAEDAYLVILQKFAHGLSSKPHRSPYRRSGTISQHEAGLVSLHDIDAGGQFIQNQLQERQSCFG